MHSHLVFSFLVPLPLFRSFIPFTNLQYCCTYMRRHTMHITKQIFWNSSSFLFFYIFKHMKQRTLTQNGIIPAECKQISERFFFLLFFFLSRSIENFDSKFINSKAKQHCKYFFVQFYSWFSIACFAFGQMENRWWYSVIQYSLKKLHSNISTF